MDGWRRGAWRQGAVAVLWMVAVSGRAAGGNFIADDDFSARFPAVEAFWISRVLPAAASIETPDGTVLRYVKVVQPQPAPAVVISSGRTEHYGKYKEIVHDLWRHGYSVYIHDHRGQGLSGPPGLRPRGHVEHFDQYVDDLQHFVQQVVRSQQPAPTRLLLLGHSMGGGIGVRHLQKHPGTFAAAAFSSPMLAPNTGVVPTSLVCPVVKATDGFRSQAYVLGEGPPELPPPAFAEDNLYTTSRARYQALYVAGIPDEIRLGGPTRRWLAEACRAGDAMLADAAAVKTPVMIVRSPDDEAVLPEAQDRFCAALKQAGNPCRGTVDAPQAPITLMGARHEIFIEHDRHRTPALQHILAFFAQP